MCTKNSLIEVHQQPSVLSHQINNGGRKDPFDFSQVDPCKNVLGKLLSLEFQIQRQGIKKKYIDWLYLVIQKTWLRSTSAGLSVEEG